MVGRLVVVVVGGRVLGSQSWPPPEGGVMPGGMAAPPWWACWEDDPPPCWTGSLSTSVVRRGEYTMLGLVVSSIPGLSPLIISWW